MNNDYNAVSQSEMEPPYADPNPNAAGEPDPMAQTRQAGAKLKDTANTAISDVQDLASAAALDGKAYAGAAVSDASAAFKDAVESNKTAGADAVASLARSAKAAADDIEETSPQIAKLVRSAADGVERVSTDIRDRNVGQLFDSVSDFAKRRPVAFFGCGMVAGLVLSRLMRASDRSA
jgi:ElaB/YqjD/DUF883 family membrane-anchored ribosome-binding protein